MNPEDGEQIKLLSRQCYDTGIPYELEYSITLPSGEVRHILGAAEAVFGDKGQVIALRGTVLDITARKTMEFELQKALEVANRAAMAKSDFLSMMSHELRTPLNAVIGMSHLLREDHPAPHQTEHLEILQFSAENLLGLINDILDFSKIDAGKIDLEVAPFDLENLAKAVLKTYEPQAEDRGVGLILDWDASLLAARMGDALRLSQILNNLISNAIKFTPQGSVTLGLACLPSHPQQDKIQIWVQDTGIGIPLDRQGDIFERFTQASSSTTREFGGTGLGLAISQRLVQLMGGVIRLISAPGEGSKFVFELDLAPTAEKVHGGRHTEVRQGYLPLGVKVLLVEDNPVNISVATKFLGKWGVEYQVAENGQIGVDLVRQSRFDLILMDLQMPVMDGYTASLKIREFNTQIPIIALTASALLDIRAKVMECGMNDYTTKPFNPRDLYDKIARWTEVEGGFAPEKS